MHRLILVVVLCSAYDENLRCQTFDQNYCGCRGDSCEFNVETGICELGNQECKNDLSIENVGPTCRRPYTWYTNGGVVCQNMDRRGRCNIVSTIWAVNFNGPALTDSRGVTFLADNGDGSLYEDPHNIRDPYVVDINFPWTVCTMSSDGNFIRGVPTADQSIYSTVINGLGRQRDPNHCIAFPIPPERILDGEYELCVKFAEYFYPSTQKKHRYGTVKFGGITILPEFDILAHVDSCTGLDVIAPFEISGGGSYLTIQGFQSRLIPEKTLNLTMCYGACNFHDPNFLASGFYIAEVGEKYDGCPDWDEQKCSCRKNGCQYNVLTQSCDDENHACNLGPPTGNSCQRAGVWYSNGGVLCPSVSANGRCSISETIIAVNLNGPELIDSRGIAYQAGNQVPPVSGAELVRTHYLAYIEGATPGDELLYHTLIFGEFGSANRGKCVAYAIPLLKDGNYELTIKTVERDLYNWQVGYRLFTVKFAGLEAFPDIDIIAAVEDRHRAMDIVVNFDVGSNGQLIYISGFTSQFLENHEALLEFCFTSCQQEYPKSSSYIAAAFSVVRF